MLSAKELSRLVRTEESQSLERKKSCPNSSELRQTLVAFANTVPPEQYAVILIGVGPDGSLHSVSSPDETQKSVLRAAIQECYPPVECSLQLFDEEGKDILAVIIPHSKNRPHFTGKSYVRIGSVSKEASAEQFEKLIASRNDKLAKLAQALGKTIEVRFKDGGLQTDRHPTAGRPADGRYRVKGFDRWLVMLEVPNLGWTIGIPTDDVIIEWSAQMEELRLYVNHR